MDKPKILVYYILSQEENEEPELEFFPFTTFQVKLEELLNNLNEQCDVNDQEEDEMGPIGNWELGRVMDSYNHHPLLFITDGEIDLIQSYLLDEERLILESDKIQMLMKGRL